MTPNDDLAFVGMPEENMPLFLPAADAVHISVVFTWDIQYAYKLQEAWSLYYGTVEIGGPAFCNRDINDPPAGFIPGLYVKPGVTFTTRGCNNRCPWCLVPEREGCLKEIPDFAEGHIIQDNNLIQASRPHVEKVFAMLRKQKRAAIFSGGIQASLVNDWFVDQFKTIRLEKIFLAADTAGALRPLEKALHKLGAFSRRQLNVYSMIGKDETLDQARERLEAIWQLGGLPFAQLYQPAEKFIDYPREWKALRREWSRPAAMFANHKS